MELVSSFPTGPGHLPKVILRFPDGAFTTEIHETLVGDPHWAPLAIEDLLADLAALGWDLPENAPPSENSVDFIRFSYEHLRAWVDGRQVTADRAVAAIGRGVRQAVLDAVAAGPSSPPHS